MSLLWAGFLLGCGFGVAARLGSFCLLRGLRQIHSGEADAPALRAYALALAVAIAATQCLASMQQIDLAQAQVVRTAFGVPGVLMGGALFGFGMVMAGSCGARALVLFAGGNLRALVVLASLGLAAQATLTGVLAPLRQLLQGFGQVQLDFGTLPAQLQAAGMSDGLAVSVFGTGWLVRLGLTGAAFGGAVLAVLSFIAPVAETFLYLQVAVGRGMSLGPVVVFGTLVGAFAVALATGRYRLEGFDSPQRLWASIAGGCLMGFGGVLAVGCSIGQGLSGLSTLAFASIPACSGIALGTYIGLKAEPSIRP